MSALEVRAEIVKLARVLRREPDELRFLAAVPAADIRHLREATHEHLFDGDRATFRGLAAASRLLPAKVTAVVARKAFAPVFLARIAGEMPTDRAIDIARRIDPVFLADVTLELDPRRVGPIIRRMPVPVVREVAAELLRRREYITMGVFVGHLSDAAIEEVIRATADEEHLLRIGLFIEARESIPKLVGMLSEDRLRRMVALAQDESTDLWAEGLSLMAHVDPPAQRTLGDMMAEESDEMLTRLVQRSQDEDLWPLILPIVARMSPQSRDRLLRIGALAEPEVLRSVTLATIDLPAELQAELRPQLDALVEERGPDEELDVAR